MKQTRIVPSSSPVTTIHVAGKAHHYFHSDVLGGCRAIIIGPDENLPRTTPPLTKGDKLKILMDCADRLHERYWAFYKVYYYIPEEDYKSRKAAFAKMERVNDASTRLIRKIKALLVDS